MNDTGICGSLRCSGSFSCFSVGEHLKLSARPAGSQRTGHSASSPPGVFPAPQGSHINDVGRLGADASPLRPTESKRPAARRKRMRQSEPAFMKEVWSCPQDSKLGVFPSPATDVCMFVAAEFAWQVVPASGFVLRRGRFSYSYAGFGKPHFARQSSGGGSGPAPAGGRPLLGLSCSCHRSFESLTLSRHCLRRYAAVSCVNAEDLELLQ